MTSIGLFKIINVCKLIISNATLGRPNETKQHYKQISESEIQSINNLLYQTLHTEKQIQSNYQV